MHVFPGEMPDVTLMSRSGHAFLRFPRKTPSVTASLRELVGHASGWAFAGPMHVLHGRQGADVETRTSTIRSLYAEALGGGVLMNVMAQAATSCVIDIETTWHVGGVPDANVVVGRYVARGYICHDSIVNRHEGR